MSSMNECSKFQSVSTNKFQVHHFFSEGNPKIPFFYNVKIREKEILYYKKNDELEIYLLKHFETLNIHSLKT